MKKMTWRKSKSRMFALALSAALMASLGTQTALASTYINSASITLDIDLMDGEDLPTLQEGITGDTGANVRVSDNARYDISDAEWSKDVDAVEMGKTYNLKVTLDAKGDYEFRSSYSSSKITVKGGTFVSARRGDSSDELIVTIRTNKAEGILDCPDDAEWKSLKYNNAKFGYASWDKVTNAAYDVYLYRNGKVVHRVENLKTTTYNFYPYMTKEGDYTFRVRAIPSSTEMKSYAEKSDWVYSDELYVDKDEVSDGTGQGQEVNETSDTPNISNPEQVGWIKNNGKWYFRYPDGSYLRNSWGKIGGVWYLFDESGEMLTGWHKRSDRYYYMSSSGAMYTGWLQDKNLWYYLNPDGAMQTGWLNVDGKTYYMNEAGIMQTGWTEIGGQYYYFYPDGHKAINEVISGFYVDNNGIWHRP